MGMMSSALQNPDLLASVLARLSSPFDLLSASAVCRLWRDIATDRCHLRSWNLDDTLLDDSTLGTQTSSAPLLPKTPPPKQWINPTSFSPLASFKTPKSLWTDSDAQSRKRRAVLIAHKTQLDAKLGGNLLCLHEDAFFMDSEKGYGFGCATCDDSVVSPRTPSPTREVVKPPPLFDIVKHKMLMGAFLGDIDLISSRIDDGILQMLFSRCPRLHTFRLVHLCPVKLNKYVAPFDLCTGNSDNEHRSSCKCSPLSNRAFLHIHKHCPKLTSVTLILQHLLFRKVLQKLLRQLGGLRNLQTLSLELRSPSFGQSTKSKVIWDSHVRFTEQEIMALIQGGPPPLHALSLNRCDLTGASLDALVSSCPHIEALELHSDFEDTKEPGFLQNAPLHLMGLASLSAVAFGVLMVIDPYTFKSWRMPCLKRLRLETRHALCNQHLYQLKLVCPELESLHLIWDNVSSSGGTNEVHIYPFTQESILKYSCGSCVCNLRPVCI